MKKSKRKNLLWWFISWLQVILLALPILNVAYRVVDYSVFAWTKQESTESSDGHIVAFNSPEFAKELNNALVYTYFDFSFDRTVEDFIPGNTNAYWSMLGGAYDFNAYYWNDFYDEYRLYDYNLTHFDFYNLVNSNDVLDYEPYGTWVLPMFFNWYMNYILTILVVFFIPYVLIFFISWVQSIGEKLISQGKEEE